MIFAQIDVPWRGFTRKTAILRPVLCELNEDFGEKSARLLKTLPRKALRVK